MLEQNQLKQITKIKILKEERKVNNNNNNNNNNNKAIMKNNNKKTLKLFHFDNNFALTMAILPRKLVPQIFCFRKYTLYLHRELICYH